MAFKSKVEKMVEFVPNNLDLAQEAYDELVQLIKDSHEPRFDFWEVELGKWMHKYTSLGYKTLCYTFFYVSQGLTPSWLGGIVEPYFESVSRPQNNTTKVVEKEPELDLSYFLDMVK